MGAWIETYDRKANGLPDFVAPYVGAWIETFKSINMEIKVKVAPYVGAWIETSTATSGFLPSMSHPTWVRGLKP